MGIEILKSAERAAGFAMVDAEETSADAAAKADEGRRIGTPALLLKEQPTDGTVSKTEAFGEWIKHMLGSSGRAPA